MWAFERLGTSWSFLWKMIKHSYKIFLRLVINLKNYETPRKHRWIYSYCIESYQINTINLIITLYFWRNQCK